MSNDALSKLQDALKRAIEAEIEGQHFYRMAAASTTDAKGKEVFEWLATEEFHHAEFLKAQLRSVQSKGTVDQSMALGNPRRLADAYPIFSDEIKSRAADAHFEMTALSVGVQLEENAIRFYKDQAIAASDGAVRKFFLELADWETSHYSALLRQQELLRDSYWTENRFSPF